MATKVIIRKLGRHGALGLADMDNHIIEIDPRQKSKSYLKTLIHEKLHLLFPDFSETKIKYLEKQLGDFLWENNYRKVNL